MKIFSNNIYWPKLILIICMNVLFCQHASSQQQLTVEGMYELGKEKLEKGASLKDNLQNSLDSPVNLLTGAVDFDIPIYTIKNGEYSIPISLHYETSGFRLTEIASAIGLGWSITGLGCITKTIKDIPDNNIFGYCNNGYGEIDDFFEIDSIILLEHKQKLALITSCSGYDKEPDIYSFNFPGHSGSFLFDKDHHIYTMPQQELIINYNTNNDVYTIIDEFGNIYYFGEGNAKEVLKQYNNTPLLKSESFWNNDGNKNRRFQCIEAGKYYEGDKNYTISWHLSKIKLASSNTEFVFEYVQDDVKAYIGSEETYMYGCIKENENSLPPDWLALRYNRFKKYDDPRITRISWKQDGYELGSIDFVPSTDARDDLQNQGAHAIEWIHINDSHANVCHSFWLKHKQNIGNYDYEDSFKKRLFLEYIVAYDSNNDNLYNYKFSYNYNDNIYKNSAKIDYWGYYKSRTISSECQLMKPTIYYYANGFNDPLYKSVYSVWRRNGVDCTYYVLNGNDMSPTAFYRNEQNGTNASLFTLTSVELPLGARVEFIYENNNFYFDAQNIIGPGSRVKEVKYKDGNQTFKTTYEYIGDDGNSSGRITSIPDFGYFNTKAYTEPYYHHPNSIEERNRLTARQISTVTDMAGASQANVRYGKVTVHNSQIGKTEYYHRLVFNAEDNTACIGDNIYIQRTPVKRVIYIQNPPNGNISSQGIPHEDSFPKFTEPIITWCGNFLEKKIIYDKENTVVESTEYKYSLKPSLDTVPYLQSRFYTRFDYYWAILDSTGNHYPVNFVLERDILWGTNSYRTGVRRLDSIVNIKYDGGIENRTVTAYKYYDNIDRKLFVKEKSIKNSDGIVEKTNYTYPFNYNTELMKMLTNNNMIATPVEEYVSKDGKVTDGTFKHYKYFGSYIKPNKVYKLRAASPLTNFSPSISGNQDARYEEVLSLKYDNTIGNTIETTEEGNAVTTYVWGYHHSLLLAVVKNADNNTVTSNMSCSMDELQNKTDPDELITIFNDLRRTLSDALITSYTYDASQHPLSVTDPNGKTCKYEYDDASRLNIIRDQDNNIVKSYDYHYR